MLVRIKSYMLHSLKTFELSVLISFFLKYSFRLSVILPVIKKTSYKWFWYQFQKPLPYIPPNIDVASQVAKDHPLQIGTLKLSGNVSLCAFNNKTSNRALYKSPFYSHYSETYSDLAPLKDPNKNGFTGRSDLRIATGTLTDTVGLEAEIENWKKGKNIIQIVKPFDHKPHVISYHQPSWLTPTCRAFLKVIKEKAFNKCILPDAFNCVLLYADSAATKAQALEGAYIDLEYLNIMLHKWTNNEQLKDYRRLHKMVSQICIDVEKQPETAFSMLCPSVRIEEKFRLLSLINEDLSKSVSAPVLSIELSLQKWYSSTNKHLLKKHVSNLHGFPVSEGCQDMSPCLLQNVSPIAPEKELNIIPWSDTII